MRVHDLQGFSTGWLPSIDQCLDRPHCQRSRHLCRPISSPCFSFAMTSPATHLRRCKPQRPKLYSVLRARVSTRLNGRGVGKTRLLDECAASAEALGICTLCALPRPDARLPVQHHPYALRRHHRSRRCGDVRQAVSRATAPIPYHRVESLTPTEARVARPARVSACGGKVSAIAGLRTDPAGLK